MSEELEVTMGSGNVFADLGYPDADIRQFKAILAARIIKLMDERKLTVRAAQEQTGVAAADFSRVRKAKLDRFSIEKLITILNRLDQRVDVDVHIVPTAKVA